MSGINERRKAEVGQVAAWFLVLSYNPAGAPVDAEKRALVVSSIDTLCGFTLTESAQAEDTIFETTDDGSICAATLAALAECSTALFDHLRSGSTDDKPVWRALYALLEVDCLYSDDEELAPATDAVFENTIASHRYFDR